MQEALRDAIKVNDVVALARAIDAGADVNDTISLHRWEDVGWFPLHFAVRLERPRCVKLLLDRNAMIDVPDYHCLMPIEHAPEDEDNAIECTRLLLDANANLFVVNPDNGNNVFHTAAKRGASRWIRIFGRGVAREHLELRDAYDETPLAVAVRSNEEEAATVLIDLGCDLDRALAPFRRPAPAWVCRLVARRHACRLSTLTLYGVLRRRLRIGRDMSGAVARAAWATRLQEEWDFTAIPRGAGSAKQRAQ